MRRFVSIAAAFALVAVLAVSASAAPVFMNFDTDFNGNLIAGGTLVNAAYPPSLSGATFSGTAVVVFSGGGVPSQPNFATGTAFTGAVTVDFLSNGFFANFVQATNVTNSNFLLEVFAADNSLLGSATFTNFLETHTLSFAGQIASARFSTTGRYGFDDLRFELVSAPEPASLALWSIMGLTGGFGAWRRRKAKVA